MKVLYDYGAFLTKYGGIAKYFCETIDILKDQEDFEYNISLLWSSSYLLKEKQLALSRAFFSTKPFKGKRTLQTIVNRTYSLKKILSGKYDIFHPTGFDDYFIKYNKKPTVITIHDMIQEKFFDKNHREIAIKRKQIENSTHIITVSENTKKDLIEIYNVDKQKISVVYHGVKIPTDSDYKEIDTGFDQYILYVGTRYWYKNFNNFVEAVAPILNSKKSLGLVCTGWKFKEYEKNLFKEKNIEKQVKVLEVSNKELNSLYKNALVFVFPSFYEGFGIPVIEAFANNCPVCLSNASCFPEIAGDAALYFDPNNIEDIREQIGKLLHNATLRESLIETGKERVKNFNWEESAKRTYLIYDKVLNNLT